MKSEIKKVKPCIKIPGGKYALLDVLTENLPKDFNKIRTYVEPFLGGGSFFLHLAANYPKLKNFHLNELNSDIWLIWNTIAEWQPEYRQALYDLLLDYKKKHLQDPNFYYTVRQNFNQSGNTRDLERAAMFLYLNKTCFNGLIRYNASGHFNSPKGDYQNPPVEDMRALLNICSLVGNKARVFNTDFQPFIEEVAKVRGINNKTFVYLDPPYVPKSITASFTAYSPSNFTEYDQRRLACVLHLIDKSGAKFMLSNSDTPTTRKIFEGFNVVEVLNVRNISCKGNTRGKTKELLIKNYD